MTELKIRDRGKELTRTEKEIALHKVWGRWHNMSPILKKQLEKRILKEKSHISKENK